jgi:hypothetical protein
MGTKKIVNNGRGGNIDKCSDKQRMFVLHLLADNSFNAAKAAEAAGYAHPPQAAHRLLTKNSNIRALLGKEQKDRETRTRITADEVLKQLGNIVFRDIADLCDEDGLIIADDIRKLPKSIRQCIDSIEVDQTFNHETGELTKQQIKYRLPSKLPAIALAMEHLGIKGIDKNGVGKQYVSWDAILDPPSEEIIQDTIIDIDVNVIDV